MGRLLQGQRELHRQSREQQKAIFTREQSAIWTPAVLRNHCCLQWLANGRDPPPEAHLCFDGCPFTEGCRRGRGCDKAHPLIEMTFDRKTHKTMATLSHPLDPFVSCFDQILEEGKGALVVMDNDDSESKNNVFQPRKCQLDGYLREILHGTHSHPALPFGEHLIHCSKNELADSDKFQKQELEQKDAEETTKKKQHQAACSPPSAELIEEALEICMENGIEKHLDVVDIGMLRLASTPATVKVVEEMVSNRMKEVHLQCRTMVDGVIRFDEDEVPKDRFLCELHSCDSEDEWHRNYESGRKVTIYKPACSEPLNLTLEEGSNDTFVLEDPSQTFSWDSGVLVADSEHVNWNEDQAMDCEGHRLQLVLQPMKNEVDSSLIDTCPLWHADLRCLDSLEVGMKDLGGGFLIKILTAEKDEREESEESTARYEGSFQLARVKTGGFSTMLKLAIESRLRQTNYLHKRAQRERPLKESEKHHKQNLEQALQFLRGGTSKKRKHGL